jgi:hypothetical protein
MYGVLRSRHDDFNGRTRVRLRREEDDMSETKTPAVRTPKPQAKRPAPKPEAKTPRPSDTITIELRPLPDGGRGIATVQSTVQALLDGGKVPAGKGAVVSSHSTKASAASSASRLRKLFAGATFVVDGQDVLFTK